MGCSARPRNVGQSPPLPGVRRNGGYRWMLGLAVAACYSSCAGVDGRLALQETLPGSPATRIPIRSPTRCTVPLYSAGHEAQHRCVDSRGGHRWSEMEGPLLGALRGGFDVWGDDSEEEAVPAETVGGGNMVRNVKEAAREAAAQAAAFKVSREKVVGQGQGRESIEGRGRESSVGPAGGRATLRSQSPIQQRAASAGAKASATAAAAEEASLQAAAALKSAEKAARAAHKAQKAAKLAEKEREQAEVEAALEEEEEEEEDPADQALAEDADDAGMWAGGEAMEGKSLVAMIKVAAESDSEEQAEQRDMLDAWSDEDEDEDDEDDEDEDKDEDAGPLGGDDEGDEGMPAPGEKAFRRSLSTKRSLSAKRSMSLDDRRDPPSADDAMDMKSFEAALIATAAGEDDDEIDSDEGLDGESSEFQPDPKWLKPEFQPDWYREAHAADAGGAGGGDGGGGAGGKSAAKGLKDEIRGLKDQRRAGKLTDEEFKERKAALQRGESGGVGGVKRGVDEAAWAKLVPLEKIVIASKGKCNMDGSSDPHYRYTMPVLVVKVEGTTKMIKSVLINVAEVAQAIGRPPSYLVTYLGQECSAMAQIDRREGIEGRAWISGKHDSKDLQTLVFKFIRETVLCHQCLGPETTVQITGRKKRKALHLDCGSCGGTSDIPFTSKFAKWMALHPVTEDASWGRVTAAAGAPLEEPDLMMADAALPHEAPDEPAAATSESRKAPAAKSARTAGVSGSSEPRAATPPPAGEAGGAGVGDALVGAGADAGGMILTRWRGCGRGRQPRQVDSRQCGKAGRWTRRGTRG